MSRIAHTAKLLLPTFSVDLERWSVIACDQFTSEPEYWQETERLVGEAPSTLRLTLPEVYLEAPDAEERIAAINRNMQRYEAEGILEELAPGMMLVQRGERRGLVLAFDLEAYDYKPGTATPIRPTEKTVESRIPPRLQVRKNATMEFPHIMLLIDDPGRTVIEPLFERTAELEQKYDLELMQGGGRLRGWFIPEGELTEQALSALDALAEPRLFREKYGLSDELPVLPFATGDGNHSMATAKAFWEQVKAGLTPEEQECHPARFVLAEVVNIHDESLYIEAIYRVLFGVEPEAVLAAAQAFFTAHGAEYVEGEAGDAQVFPWYAPDRKGSFSVKNSPWALPVATLQAFLDAYLSERPEVRIDYIHGQDSLKKLSGENGNMGFFLPDPAKADLFRGVILDGVLPRKTFSMGEAREKRYYMEGKRILP